MSLFHGNPHAIAGLASAICQSATGPEDIEALKEAEGFANIALKTLKGKTSSEYMFVRAHCNATLAMIAKIKVRRGFACACYCENVSRPIVRMFLVCVGIEFGRCIFEHLYVCMYVCMYVCVCVYIYMYMCVCVYVYMYI